MRVIVTGSRGWTDRGRIRRRLAQLPPNATIVVGYDPVKKRPGGADRFAFEEAPKLGLLVEPHPARWDEQGKRAGFVRNKEMAYLGAVLCIAFWDGRSTGTFDMMGQAVKHGIPVDVVMDAPDPATDASEERLRLWWRESFKHPPPQAVASPPLAPAEEKP